MQEAGKSIILVFAPIIIFNSTLANLLCKYQIYDKNVIFLWAFFNNHVYIDMYG